MPASQSVHRAEPLSVLYFPAAHAPHAPPSGPACPALQTQLATAPAPKGEFEFAGHEAHVVAATTAAEYFPAPHHWQALSDTAPAAAEALPASHSRQELEYNVQYFPAPHCVHVFAYPEPEVKMVTDPSAHFVHAAAPAAEM